MYVCIIHLQYFRDENSETLERAAEEKQKIHASMKEADERVKEMTSKVADLKVRDAYMNDLVLTLQRTSMGMKTIVYGAHNLSMPLFLCQECIQVKDAVIRDLQAQLAPLQRAPLQV